ncbi:hypothetical protein P167DRAFT_606038 [Morchella conica CCBAS932]|uniref:Uncharacterized protein n=1 Tax=Morchella conica CCBAS932 TaxID=1392247 RepID=A0A3N4KU56_9PEZI|nr:hypothetical protein P167DRAFT_606038 [Morchella conica CCBAS932]
MSRVANYVTLHHGDETGHQNSALVMWTLSHAMIKVVVVVVVNMQLLEGK